MRGPTPQSDTRSVGVDWRSSSRVRGGLWLPVVEAGPSAPDPRPRGLGDYQADCTHRRHWPRVGEQPPPPCRRVRYAVGRQPWRDRLAAPPLLPPVLPVPVYPFCHPRRLGDPPPPPPPARMAWRLADAPVRRAARSASPPACRAWLRCGAGGSWRRPAVAGGRQREGELAWPIAAAATPPPPASFPNHVFLAWVLSGESVLRVSGGGGGSGVGGRRGSGSGGGGGGGGVGGGEGGRTCGGRCGDTLPVRSR